MGNSPRMEDLLYEHDARALPLAVSAVARFVRESMSGRKNGRRSEKNRQGHQGGNRAETESQEAQARDLCGVLGPGYCDSAGTAGLLHGTCTPKALLSTPRRMRPRSEEHTSDLQSLMGISYAAFCLKKQTR